MRSPHCQPSTRLGAGAAHIADHAHLPHAESERSRLRALLSAGQSGTLDVPDALGRLCGVSVAELRLSGAVASLMAAPLVEEGQSGTIAAASNEWARSVEELEFSLGEGPGTDAFLASRPVLVPDLERAQGRWPGYASAALAAGSRAVFAFPLHIGAARFGVLSLHCSRIRSLSEPELASTLMLTELATEILLDGFSGARDGTPSESSLLGTDFMRDEIYQAQGMVMVTLGVSLPEALARLRAHAFASNQDLTDLATDIVAGRVRLSPDPGEAR